MQSEVFKIVDAELCLVPVDEDDGAGFFFIERVHHSGERWVAREVLPDGKEITFSHYSGRLISDADIEGSTHQLKELAKAILEKRPVHAKRCAIDLHGQCFFALWSPKNSRVKALVPNERAFDLAEKILTELVR